MKNKVRKVIRSFSMRDLEKGSNVFAYMVNSNWNKIHVFDSELLRIVEAADAEHVVKKKHGKEWQTYLPGLISVKIGRSTSIYREMADTYGGELILKHLEFVPLEKSSGEYEIRPVLDRDGSPKQEVFVRLISGSSQGRAKKALYIKKELFEDVNKVLLGGMDELAERNGYPRFSGGYAKWNTYYGLASTDSKAVETPAQIVVVKDFKRETKDCFDVLHPFLHTYEKSNELSDGMVSTEYTVENGIEKAFVINPFDGAGLVSKECAERWAAQLGLDSEKELPGAFQIRVIPGIKGNLYTFDIREFGRRSGKKIIDIQGREYDPEKVDVILTESQTKFLKMYERDPKLWRSIFDRPVVLKNGKSYQRTFNISDHAVSPSELRNRTRSTYQHWQTIHNTKEECERVCSHTLNQLEKISLNADEFLNYRCYNRNEDTEEMEWDQMPPCYKTAYYADSEKRKILFADPYFQEKMNKDLRGAYLRALTGKLSIEGNYQLLVPDLYALAQHCFGEAVTGLLSPKTIYSDWWLSRAKKERKLALIRNPHIYMEARIAELVSEETAGQALFKEMKNWYRYQRTGIITDSYSTIPLALGTADFDGDNIITTSCREYIDGVERAIQSGNGNTVILEQEGTTGPDAAEDVRDMAKLLEADLNAYTNDIGSVINQVTSLWGIPWSELDQRIDGGCRIRDYIKMMDITGQLTIDAAKTGEAVKIPYDIQTYIREKKLKKPYFMNTYKKKDALIPKDQSSIRETDAGANNMDHICHLVEQKLVEIHQVKSGQAASRKEEFSVEQFLKLFIRGKQPQTDSAFYQRIKGRLMEISDQNKGLFAFLRMEDRENKAVHYSYLYDYAKEEFLQLGETEGVSADRLLDYLIYICYTDSDFFGTNSAKNVLWNCFVDEMVERIRQDAVCEADFSGLDQTLKQLQKQYRDQKKEEAEAKPFRIGVLEDAKKEYHRIRISQKDIDLIMEKIPGNHVADKQLRRLYAVLMVIFRYWGKVRIRNGGNNDLTRMALAELCGMKSQRKKIYEKLQTLQELGAIRMNDLTQKEIRVRVVFGDPEEGEMPKIDTEDYKEACEKIIRLVDTQTKRK